MEIAKNWLSPWRFFQRITKNKAHPNSFLLIHQKQL